MSGFRRLYGSHPLHLIGHLGLFFIAGWAITQILGGGFIINWIAWFLGAALLHDLVLLPIYSTLDRGVVHDARRRRPGRAPHPSLNHIRVPAMIAGVLLLVYCPVILGLSARNYRNDTGHQLAGYTRNWLLITAGLFLSSALVYVMRVMRRRRPRPTPTPSREHPGR
jgi:hypothetical protein